ncbi:CPBP family intramembrane glutamic endopeptidase [Gracilimonas sp. Q87]|uniref:CPBP family intramembrane glutamic endopeptidase n=1 Tax=Gracilimonas sp. Q87 TaxID=3384766 RepID=UPI0039842A5E
MPFTLLLVLVLLILTWLSIYLLEKRNIYKSWITPGSQRINEFVLGLFLMGLLCIVSQIFLSLISDTSWIISEDITMSKFLYASAFDINSVLFEELLFRGVLLYGLIRLTNHHKAVIISAVAFGIYHWFTYGVLGNILGMVLVFITTGFMGYVFAKAYVKTKSIILPIGLHLGWNWINNSIFSNGPNGTVLLAPNQTVELEGYFAIISFLWYLIIPAVVLIILKTDIFDKLMFRSSIKPAT